MLHLQRRGGFHAGPGPTSGGWWWHHHWTHLSYHKWHCSNLFFWKGKWHTTLQQKKVKVLVGFAPGKESDSYQHTTTTLGLVATLVLIQVNQVKSHGNKVFDVIIEHVISADAQATNRHGEIKAILGPAGHALHAWPAGKNGTGKNRERRLTPHIFLCSVYTRPWVEIAHHLQHNIYSNTMQDQFDLVYHKKFVNLV